MGVLTLPKTLVPGANENVNDVTDNFTAVRTLINGNLDGDNLSQATGEALAVSGTNYPRRGVGSGSLSVSSSTYVTVIRAPTVVMPTAGILHVSLLVQAAVSPSTSQTISFAIRLNGVTARSRYGIVASGASTGLMEVTGLVLDATAVGTQTGAMLFTDTTDTGVGSLVSTVGGGALGTQPVGAFVPVVAAAGSYVVDMVAKLDAGTDVLFSSGRLRVRAEGF